jgi:uncharacterized protein (TIGR00369 family)
MNQPHPPLEPEKAKNILERISRIPIYSTLEMREVFFSDGFCRMTVPREKAWDGIFESLHGGIMMTAADSASAFAILTRTGPEARMTTTDMGIRFLAPCLSDLVVEAGVIKFGRTLCPCEVELKDTAGRLCAVAQVCYMLLDRAGPSPK